MANEANDEGDVCQTSRQTNIEELSDKRRAISTSVDNMVTGGEEINKENIDSENTNEKLSYKKLSEEYCFV